MKKTIVLMALALIMVSAVFAALPADKETQVVLDLSTDPTYVMAVTANANRAEEDSKTLTHVSEIDLGYDKDDEARPITYPADKTYYVSYRFYETENVKLTMELSGDMLLENKTADVATAAQRIGYTVTLAKDDDAKENSKNEAPATATLSSKTDAGVAKDITSLVATNKVGQVDFDNFKLNISSGANAKSTTADTSVVGKELGKYTSTITLSVISND